MRYGGKYVCFWHFSDIEAALFNVRHRSLFGPLPVGRSCRRMTQSRHLASRDIGRRNPWGDDENFLTYLRGVREIE
jgi:hypothetical protein